MSTYITKRGKHWYFKKLDPQTGKVVFQSLKTADKRIALERAKPLAADLEAGRWDRILALRARNALPKVGELLHTYLANWTVLDLEERTASECAKYFARVLALGCGVEDASGLSLSVLHGEAGAAVVRKFMAEKVKARAGAGGWEDEDEERRAKGSVNSALRQARAVVGVRALQLYRDKGLQLPDLERFKNEPGFMGVGKQSYNPPGDELLEKTFKALAALGKDPVRKDQYLAVCLAAGAGLRKGEIKRASWNWFTLRGAAPWLVGAMITKNGDLLDVPILPEWWARIAALRPEGAKGEDRILSSDSEWTFRRVGEWMRGLGWETQKCIHEFRALVGCRVAEAMGIEAASLFLRHGSIKTTQIYYGRYLRLRGLKPIELVPVQQARDPEPAGQAAENIIPLPAAMGQ